MCLFCGWGGKTQPLIFLYMGFTMASNLEKVYEALWQKCFSTSCFFRH